MKRYLGSLGQRVHTAIRGEDKIRRHPLMRREMCRVLAGVTICTNDLSRSELGGT